MQQAYFNKHCLAKTASLRKPITAETHSYHEKILTPFVKELKVPGRKVQLAETRSCGCLCPAIEPWGKGESSRFRFCNGRKETVSSSIVSVGCYLPSEEKDYTLEFLQITEICFYLFIFDFI